MTTASKKRAGRKVAEKKTREAAKVVPMVATTGLVLEELERLKLENLTLRLQTIQAEAEKQAAPLLADRMRLGAEIEKRLGIKIDAYSIDLPTDALTPINGGPEKAAEVPSNGEDQSGG